MEMLLIFLFFVLAYVDTTIQASFLNELKNRFPTEFDRAGKPKFWQIYLLGFLLDRAKFDAWLKEGGLSRLPKSMRQKFMWGRVLSVGAVMVWCALVLNQIFR